MARLPPVVVHEAGLRLRGGDGRRSCMLMGTSHTARWLALFKGRGPFQDVGKAAGSNIWERPVVRCCVLRRDPNLVRDIGWLIYWGGCQRTDQRRGNPKRVVVGARGCAGSVLICSRLRMGVMKDGY